MTYSQYDFVTVRINGIEQIARPYEFDSYSESNTNEFGKFVKPTKLSTSCPSCGCGVFLDVIMPDPPFPILDYNCPECNTAPLPVFVDHFVHPVESGHMTWDDINPSYGTAIEEVKLKSKTKAASGILPLEPSFDQQQEGFATEISNVLPIESDEFADLEEDDMVYHHTNEEYDEEDIEDEEEYEDHWDQE